MNEKPVQIPKFTIADLPALDDAQGIAKFAHKFDGYEYYCSIEECSRNAIERKRDSLPSVLNELFFACRSARHGGGNDDVESYKALRPYLEKYADNETSSICSELPLSIILNRPDWNFDPSKCKFHFACSNGIEDPLDVFLSGKWKEWQEDQTRKNFERKFIISLIKLGRKDLWLFAGVFVSNGVTGKDGKLFKYQTSEVAHFKSLSGRLVLNYKKDFRNSYPYAENAIKDVSVYEIKSQSLAVNEFSGYSNIFVSYGQLQYIINTVNPSWKGALASVNGIYLITDSHSGKLYIGSAYGIDGIWGRWNDYVNDGHGGNKILRELNGFDCQFKYKLKFSILEVIDKSETEIVVVNKESEWKSRLGSRINGYNEN